MHPVITVFPSPTRLDLKPQLFVNDLLKGLNAVLLNEPLSGRTAASSSVLISSGRYRKPSGRFNTTSCLPPVTSNRLNCIVITLCACKDEAAM